MNPLELVAIEGPLEGSRHALDPKQSLLIGRSKRGIHIPDPLVSIEHAEISFTTDRFYVTDLGSLTGTFIDDRRLDRTPAPLREGQRIRIGESTFLVVERKVRPAWLYPAIGLVALAGVIFVVFAAFAIRPVRYEPVLDAGVVVRQYGTNAQTLAIPLGFVRTYGLDHRDLQVQRVTDFDGDGVDEVWLEGGGRVRVITFGTEGWRTIGDLPPGCFDRAAATLPDQRCGSDIYAFHDGQYRLVGHDAVVAWVYTPPPPPPPEAEPAPPPPPAIAPDPYRLTLVDDKRLTGFLAERGVIEPVHYLVCEEAIPGVRAQALTNSGRIVPLDPGCIDAISVVTGTGDEPFAGRVPVMFAFTAVGRQALLDDLTSFLSGAPDGLLLDPVDRARMDAIRAEPRQAVMVRLSFLAEPSRYQPIASEELISLPRALAGSGTVPGRPERPARTVTLAGPGVARFDPPGCSELQVEAPSWHCVLARLCMPNDTFLTVRQVGCGEERELLVTPFGGVSDGRDAHIEVRAVVEAHSGTNQVDVTRARLSWRVLDAADASADAGAPPVVRQDP